MLTQLVNEAKKWIGYKEKATNTNLLDFNKNPGYNNFSIFNYIYNRDLAPCALNEEWCWTFIVVCIYNAFDKEKTKTYLNNSFNLYNLINNNAYKIPAKNNKPQIGDIAVFFDTKQQWGGHVGLVTDVTNSAFTTVEGNVATTTCGGMVVERVYSLLYPYVFSYCRPLYNVIHLGDRTLSLGQTGDDVKELQTLLQNLHYSEEKITGYFSNNTSVAVKDFQVNHNLTVDGIVGKNTALKIGEMASESTTKNIEKQNFIIDRILKYGAIGYDIEWLQKQLNDFGFSCGKADGIFGNQTLNAVKNFQKKQQLTVDGLVGKQTVAALGGVWKTE